MDDRILLRAVMTYVAGGHILTGLFCVLGRRGIMRLGAPLYGADFEPDAQFSHIVRPAGAFVGGLGVLQLLAARDPDSHTEVVDASIGVLLFRVLQSIIHRREISRVFQISPARHYLTTAHFAALAVILLAARLRAADDAA
ncbi:MAG: hypothetical protein ACR2JR_12320 [Rubrobacteraceae bacterium]